MCYSYGRKRGDVVNLYERIKQRRKELHLTQDELAHKLGYTDRSSIAKIEIGKVDLSESKIMAFAKALECTPAYLMGWSNHPNQLTIYDEIGYDGIELKTMSRDEIDYFTEKLTNEERIILNCYRKLDNGQKDMLRRMIGYSEALKELEDK